MVALVALLAWVVAAYRLPARDQRTPAAWSLLATLVALAAGLTFKVPLVHDALGEVAGVPDLAQLLIDACVVASGCGAQLVLLYLLHAPAAARAPAARRVVLSSTAVAAMTLIFLTADRPKGGVEAVATHLADPGLLEFRLTYLAFFGWALADIARLCWRFAALSDDRLLAAGLRTIAAGCLSGLGYVTASGLQVLAAARQDPNALELTQTLAEALIAIAALLVLAGSSLPAIGSRLGLRPSRTPDEDTDQLAALWQALTQAVPDVILPTDRGTAEERLYRQVIEIEDARRALRPLRDPAVEQAAAQAVTRHNVQAAERAAATEGVALALAVDRHLAGVTLPTSPVGPSALPLVGPAGPPAGRDLPTEVRWLSAVGRWYAHEALVTAAQALLHRATTTGPDTTGVQERAHAS